MHNGNGNGNGVAERIEKTLVGEPLTAGYKPTLPLWTMYSMDMIPQFYLMRDIELMMIHPIVRSALEYFKSGVAGAEFWGGEAQDGNPQGVPICESNQEVDLFVREQCRRYWDWGVPKIQGGYEYGWIGAECLYTEQAGRLAWDNLLQFSPRDTFLLTWNKKSVGVRVKQVSASPGYSLGQGQVDLWTATKDVPAKGLWYAHNPRYSQYYGQSQLLGAWRPWRRLAWKDAAETVVDGGIYRFAYSGPVVRYPEDDMQAQPGSPATTVDSQGRPRRYARDMARMIAELYKTGAGVGIPSSKYPHDMGGGDKWDFEIPTSTLNVEGLISYVQYLCDQIRYGVGIPPELLEAAETGSGYSGRSIPLEGFIMTQQRLANALLALFVNQVLRPLVFWNFGDVKWQVKVMPLMMSKQKGMMMAKEGNQTVPGQQPGMQPPQAHGQPSMNQQPQNMMGQGGGGSWSPHTGQNGQQGWKSQGGRVLYQPNPPGAGMSMHDRIQEIAFRILRRAA